jgi:hypothetical protein
VGQAAAAKRQRRKAPKAPVIEAAPDVLGDEGRAQVLAELLFTASKQVFRFEAIRIANGHEMDDPVAGMPATEPGTGLVNSYRRVTEQAREQEQRLARAFPELIDRVRELVKLREAQR